MLYYKALNGRIYGTRVSEVLFMRDDFYTRIFGNEKGKDYKKKNGFFTSEKKQDTDFKDNGGFDMPKEDVRLARAAFSRIGISLSVFSVISYAVVFITYLVLQLAFGEISEKITGSVWFIWGMNVVSMYLIAFPVMYLIVRNMKTVRRPKSKLYPDELFHLFLISEAVMMAGNLIGVSLNSLISTLIGKEVTNGVAELITDSPIWVITLVAVIIGPIVEELIFRKLIIDRLSVFGDLTAVITSAVLFGLFHGNLYQFFYAAGLGIVLGYIYTKTRNVIYPIIIHMLINFMGSIVALPISDMLVEFEKMSEAAAAGGEVDMERYLFISAIIFAYAALEYGFAIAGAFILVRKLRAHDLYISNTQQIAIPKRKIVSISILNLGIILFALISLLQIAINIFTV